ncbi:MAG: FAD:protein FMN transferase [Dysgonamonadaceae bacterium]|jgi:thiamine biosynthesis lipoprotein|nr:FAD:protein FMN transferase [Dysgonamonadaceae bacterium]
MYTNYYPSSGLFHGSIPKVMGTQLDALFWGGNPAEMDELWQSIVAEVIKLEKILNRFDAASELRQINTNAMLYPVGMNDELWNILMDCKRYYELTEGYFDITLGHWENVEFDETNRTVFFVEKTFFDLGGYAKGYALEKIRLLLKQQAVSRALVNFGNSTTLALGTHPHGNYWPVGIDNPYNNRRMDNIYLCDASLSVSGNTPIRTAHIVRPATKEYVTTRKMAVVVSVYPIEAEALTTALMAAEISEAEKWLNRFDIVEYKMYDCKAAEIQ